MKNRICIKINDKEQCHHIQTEMFKLGYRWASGDTTLRYDRVIYLQFIIDAKVIYFTSDVDWEPPYDYMDLLDINDTKRYLNVNILPDELFQM